MKFFIVLEFTSIDMLQSKDFKVDQWKEPYIRVNIRELNRELYTRLYI